MLSPGTIAPDFTLPDQAGEPVTLSALLAGGPVVLYFYPRDFTPLCTQQACMIRDLAEALNTAGLRVIGISPDAPEQHESFAAAKALPFMLLSDVDKTVIRAYAVNGPMGMGLRRATFLIGRDGLIADAVTADFRLSRHRQFIENAIAANRP